MIFMCEMKLVDFGFKLVKIGNLVDEEGLGKEGFGLGEVLSGFESGDDFLLMLNGI